MARSRSVVSVQSHVAYGHVGNASAVFPLQRLGFEVWPVHTCQLSCRIGYPDVRGESFTAGHVGDILGSLAAAGHLGRAAGLVSGYLGRAEIGGAILTAVDALHAGEGRGTYLCDPVMGDDDASGVGRLYAAADIPMFMRSKLVPQADVITPNRFELQLLARQPVTTLPQAVTAARSLLGSEGTPGPTVVVGTSLPMPSTDDIGCLAVTADAAWLVSTPRLKTPEPIHGTGDAFSALVLGCLLNGEEPPEALSHAVSALYAVIETTLELGEIEPQLVAAQDLLLNPPKRFEAVAV